MIRGKVIDRCLARASRWLTARGVRPEVVFIGDSITEFWSAADPWLFRPVRINAGISGNVTGQMRARFAADVIARAPRVVHIMGGTNDLWYGGAADSLENITAMVRQAKAAGIAVVLAPPPPIGRKAEAMFEHLEMEGSLRAGIADLARDKRVVLVDYAESLVRGGDLFARFTTDGVHLTRAGYRAIRKQAEGAIREAISTSPPWKGGD